MSHNLTDHFKLYFPDEKNFPSQNLPMERFEWEATNLFDIVLYNAVSREKNEF
jgi:hypothetical protein